MTPRALLPFKLHDVRETLRAFSPTERAVFVSLAGLCALSLIGMLWQANNTFFLEVPAHGGTYSEGIVGTPRFINPLLAASDADQDMTALVYAGLLKPTALGTLTAALAESYRVSEDGLTYVFTLRQGAVFHDGTPVTAQDVVFTVERAQDPAQKSPRRANWEGVRVEELSPREVAFTLTQPYGPFLENAVLGILPKHIWQNVGPDEFPFSQFNVEPVGAGPYRVEKVHRNSSGLPEYYELSSFDDYALGRPFIKKFIARFYSSEDALLLAYGRGEVEAVGHLSPQSLARLGKTDGTVLKAPLPRIFGIFFNQNVATVFVNATARAAVEAAIDKDAIIRDVLFGYARKASGPIPPNILNVQDTADDVSPAVLPEPSERARELLTEDGWTLDGSGVWNKKVSGEVLRLTFSLSTSNTPELKAVAELLVRQLEAAGIPVELKFFDVSDLNQNVIRPRRYDALLFGEIIGRELDLFPFWHASQRNDPGLNIALYANIAADRALETARTTSDEATKLEALKAFSEEVRKDVPAVFLYAPDFLYLVPHRVRGVALGPLSTSGERFMDIERWYIETERIWPFLAERL